MALEIHYNVFGCFRRPAEDIKLAEYAVDSGFEGVWIGDHFHPWIDSRSHAHHVLPWLGSVMQAIPDVPVGTSVTCPTIRHRPASLAQAIATLDNMYPGRLEIGLGSGEAINETPFLEGEWPSWGERTEMLIESIEIMRKLWGTTDFISYDGSHYQYENIKLYTEPVEDIGLHWAGWGKQSCRCAGKYTGNLITNGSAEKIENEIIPPFLEGVEKRGRDKDKVDITTEYVVNYGNPHELVTEIRKKGEYVPYDAELDNPDPRDVQSVADEHLAEASDEDLIELNTITQDPSQIVEELRTLDEAGVSRVLVGSNCGDPRATIDIFESEIFPHFR